MPFDDPRRPGSDDRRQVGRLYYAAIEVAAAAAAFDDFETELGRIAARLSDIAQMVDQ